MDEIASRLEQWQKDQLQEVADGMLKIYRTLQRMQFLEDHMIEEGPHDLEEMLSVYKDLKIEDSIIYLYSILPYVNETVDFFKRGATLDLRQQDNMEEARNPLYDQDYDLHPWMTALSSISNHNVALIYDAKRHVIGMFEQEDDGSADPRIRSPTPASSRADELGNASTRQEEEDDGTLEGTCEDEMNQDEDGEDNDGDAYDSDDPWAEMEARSAPKVLRDIVRWYEDLTELPGDGEFGEWDNKITEPLYIKYGWPGAGFDGEAFLVAKAIKESEKRYAKDEDKGKEKKDEAVENLESQLQSQISQNEGEWGFQHEQAIIDSTDDPEKEWKARWRMFNMTRARINLERRIREEREKAQKMPQDIVATSEHQIVLQNLSSRIKYCENKLKTLGDEVQEAGGLDKISKGQRSKVLTLRKEARIYEKACDTYKKEHNITVTERPKYYSGQIDLRERLWYFMTILEGSRDEVAALREFLADMPDDIKEARVEAESVLKRHSNMRQQAPMEIEKFEGWLRDAGYEGWPLDR